MTRRNALTLATVLLAQTATAVDLISLKNGDRISGSIVRKEGDTIIIKTPYADKVTIDWAEVSSVQSDEPHMVRVKPDNFVNAKMKQSADGIVLEGDDLRSGRTIPAADIVSIGVPPGARWQGVLQGNVAGTSGNIQTFALGGMAEAIRKTDDDRLRFGASTDVRQAQANTFAGTDRNGSPITKRKTVQTGQNHRAWVLYDYNLDDHWSLGGYTRFEHDKFKDLNYRALLGGGPRYRFFDTKTEHLSVYLGMAYIFESLNSRIVDRYLATNPGLNGNCRARGADCPDEKRDFVSLALGDEFRMKLTDSLSVYQLLDIYPNVQDFSDTLFHAEAGLRQKVLGGLFLGVGLADDFDTKPADGRKKNDFSYFGNVGYEF